MNYLSTEVPSKLGISAMRANVKNEGQLFVTMPDAAAASQDLGGLITVHAEGKEHGCFENITNNFKFKMEIKKDLLRDHVDI